MPDLSSPETCFKPYENRPRRLIENPFLPTLKPEEPKSLVGTFATVAELMHVLLRDLTRQVRILRPGKAAHPGRIDRAREITD
jgi:hypothetical protein